MVFPTRGTLGAAALCLALASPAVHAEFPERAITMVVPTAAGGGNDTLARVIGQKMGELLGQTVIVVNKPGAQGAIAADYVARQPADGYTLMLGYIGTHGINPALQKLNYDPVRDFTAIGMVADSPTLMVVSSSIGVQDVPGLLKYGQAHPDGLSYASAGPGTAPAVAGELFNRATGAAMLEIPYKGSAPAMTDTLAGVTQVMFPSLFSAYPHLKSGKIRALGVAGTRRAKVLPDMPTLAELGVPGVDVAQWYAVFAPANADPQVVAKLNTALNGALNDPAVAAKIDDQGAEVRTSTPAELAAFVREEAVKWKKLASTIHAAL
ncbi:ABC transporter substrate-binding protein [Achromobacter xylosoxidans]|uniref:Tripartite tricarboxylate transporter substrate binding protein n=2 Tax=Achromobacter ruhlandii TaxID=72557 RepID=A0A848NK38_9BURK|nr:tripartite tricarboxylate transporter substrate binding protein [Achromobacter ruhlandii]AKP91713.1 putative exported protein [Achromobacter xylosoxidans]ALX85823.1 ABC transporter substrate-binding protein [Achromobacter denitrificans]AOU94945.1 tripartite tricarboxylate transporter [Achromobacter ruhlandii]MCV6797822.1 tripartite tricarboxylate transporter substrate binding protein [Achromobacter ruhlandii]MCV6810935.1 tripartite tricarboxylate transporter substrate binding protein [Achro